MINAHKKEEMFAKKDEDDEEDNLVDVKLKGENVNVKQKTALTINDITANVNILKHEQLLSFLMPGVYCVGLELKHICPCQRLQNALVLQYLDVYAGTLFL